MPRHKQEALLPRLMGFDASVIQFAFAALTTPLAWDSWVFGLPPYRLPFFPGFELHIAEAEPTGNAVTLIQGSGTFTRIAN